MQMGGSAAEQDPHKAARPVGADGGELLNMSVLVWVAARAGLGEGGTGEPQVSWIADVRSGEKCTHVQPADSCACMHWFQSGKPVSNLVYTHSLNTRVNAHLPVHTQSNPSRHNHPVHPCLVPVAFFRLPLCTVSQTCLCLLAGLGIPGPVAVLSSLCHWRVLEGNI